MRLLLVEDDAGLGDGVAAGLRQAGFGVDEKSVRAHGKSGARHVIWLATRA
jgi:spermidine synthase